jgi:hypothetical protein
MQIYVIANLKNSHYFYDQIFVLKNNSLCNNKNLTFCTEDSLCNNKDLIFCIEDFLCVLNYYKYLFFCIEDSLYVIIKTSFLYIQDFYVIIRTYFFVLKIPSI